MRGLELVDSLFPEPDEPDILDGLADFTNGKAVKYFSGLTADDRDIVQSHLKLGVGLWLTADYARNFAIEYAEIDPERIYVEAIKGAHQRVKRVERFVEVFLESTDFFPAVERATTQHRDENGRRINIQEEGWGQFGSKFNLKLHQDSIKKQMLPLFPFVHAFLDDPAGAPNHFNQAEILRKFQERRERPA